MANTINATSTGAGGLITTGDDSGVLNIQTNETTAITVDASQNVGVGVTPSAWQSGRSIIELGGSVTGQVVFNGSSNNGFIATNVYNSGSGNLYKNSNYATSYNQTSGQHQWYTAPSGTAGNAITFTQAMTLTASGYLGIGTTNPLAGFANYQTTSQLSTGNASSNGLWNVTNRTNASNNATTDVLRFLTATGALLNGYVSGHVYITATGASGGNGFSGVYTLNTTSNGNADAIFTLVTSVTRGTNPLSSVNFTSDGAGGAVKVIVTWINNSGVVTGGGCTASFVGIAS